MIKICIVLSLLVAVVQSETKCTYNQVLTSGTACECAAADGTDLVISTGEITARKYCNKVGTTYTKKTYIATACTDDKKVVTGEECTVAAAAANIKICIIEQYKPASATCSEWCDKGEDAKCVTCHATEKTKCLTCNAGYDTIGSATCTACASTKFTAGGATDCATCTVCESPKVEDTACTTTADRTCKAASASSSMSLGIQTVLIIGIMNFM